MIFTVVGWLIGWLIEVSFFPSVKLSGYQVPPQLHYVVLIGLSIVVLGFIIRFGPTARRVWISMMTIGLIAGVVFLFEPKWTPSGLLKDISVSLWSNSRVNWPTFERFALIGALVSGMVVAAVMTRSFQLQAFKSKEVLKNILAGMLMGLGAAFAGGGNDSQLLLALPSLSPAGASTVASMVLGIYLVNRFALRPI